MSLDYSIYMVYFHRLFSTTEDGLEYATRTLTAIRNIGSLTNIIFFHDLISSRNILYEHQSKELFNERLRQLFHVISENRNIIKLSYLNSIHIPRELLIEWFNNNKFVSTLLLSFPSENQSNISLTQLCYELKRDTAIKHIEFMSLPKNEPDIQLLVKSLQAKKGLDGIEINGVRTPQTIVLSFLNDLLTTSPVINNCQIKELKITDICGCEYISIDYANQIENIITANSTLSSLTMCNVHGLSNDILFSIIRGVINSNNIINFNFFPLNSLRYYEDIIQQNQLQHERLQMITKMDKIKYFSFRIDDFNYSSKELITSTLNGMKSLNLLEIEQYEKGCCHILQYIIKDMSTWEQQKRQCKLKLLCDDPQIDLLPLLKDVQLVSLSCRHINHDTFHKIIEEIPSWIYLTDLTIINSIILSSNTVELSSAIKFTYAIYKNCEIKNISISDDSSSLFNVEDNVQNNIDNILIRNKRLDECKNNPDKVPFTQWPELFILADPTGINFSYECIRKIPDRFITFFQNDC